MSVLQYVGARYVPKLFDDGNGGMEWKADTYYEPLTIVTYNNTSYISRGPVAASVGNPAVNGTYWAETGNYNAYIETLQERIDSLVVISTPEMYGATGNGVSDDTDAVIKCLNDSNHIKIFRKDAVYNVNFLGEITGKSFMILGNGATLRQINGNFVTILNIVGWNSGVKNIAIYDLIFDGNRGANASQFPIIRINAGNGHTCSDITLERCEVRNTQGYGIGVYNELSNPGVLRNINILHCRVHDVSGVGIATTNAQVRYCDNVISNTGAEAITLDNYSYDSYICRNNITFYGHGGGIGIDTARNSIIEGNIVDGSGNTSPEGYQNGITINTGVGDSQGLVISGNELFNNAVGISFGSPNHVSDNVVKGGSICGNDLSRNTSSIHFMWIGADTSCSIKGNSIGKITVGALNGLQIAKAIDTDITLDITPQVLAAGEAILSNVTAYIKDKVLYLYANITVPAGTEGYHPVATIDVRTNNISMTVFTKSSPMAYKDLTFINGVLSSYVTAGEGGYSFYIEFTVPLL